MTNMSSIGPNKEVPLAGRSLFMYFSVPPQALVVGDGSSISSSSSALSTKLEQEQQNLSPLMRDFVKALEQDAQRTNAGFRPSYPNRSHTI